MEKVLQYRIPVLHPFAVHFPVALVLVALAFVMMWLIRDRIHWLVTAMYIQLIGFVGSLVAYFSGEAMEEQSEGVPIVEELVHHHEDMALAAVWLIGVSLVSMFATRFFSNRDTTHPGTRLRIRFLVSILAISAALVVAWTARIGATMVWGVSP